MNEISPEEAEAIIEAATNGASLETHRDLGELLNALNSPASTADHTPPLIAPPDSITGRIMRRTAVAASSAVLGLATVAAATTGAPALLDPILGDDPAVVIAPEEEGASDGDTVNDEGGEDADQGADATEADPEDRERPEQAQGPKDDHEPGPDEAKGPDREIEGVDPSDGLDDEELMVACEAVDNHGHYVSLVARDKITEHDGTHGERVSEAAQSDCGKDDDDGEAEAGEEPVEAAEPEDEGEDAETEPGENGRDQGQGQGKGHRESNGKGHEGNNGNGKGVGNGHAKYDDTEE